MRFKIGDKVEVMNDKEVPVSWRTAEVLSVSGHKYLVQYDSYPCIANDRIVEMVLRKLVRPWPPVVEGVEGYIVGDVVEVFYQYSWKIGVVLDIMVRKREIKRNRTHRKGATFQRQYSVRLLGCLKDLVIGESSIRIRQTWHGDKWILMGKNSRSGDDDIIASKPSTSNCSGMNSQVPQLSARASNRPIKNRTIIQDGSSRSRKRISPDGSSIFEAHNQRVQKSRAIEKEGRKHRVVADAIPVVQKVDAVAYPKEILGAKNMHASFKIISNGYNTERDKQHGFRNSELNNSDSDACSVGSCSVTNQSLKTLYRFCKETDGALDSDAESFYGERKSFYLPAKEELDVRIRSLELHAYRSTLEALYASGPLSWEQEAMLTNLRITLHISNDEHLKELKQLISAKNVVSVR